MERIGQAIDTFLNSQLIPLAATVIVAAVGIVGCALIVGHRQLIDWAKSHIFHIVIGTVLIYLGSNIVQSFITSLGYTGF